MAEAIGPDIQRLCRSLHVEAGFFAECLRESAVEIEEVDGRVGLGNGSVLRLRQLERLCATLEVDLPVALLVLELTRRVEELEEELRRGRLQKPRSS